MSGDGIELTRVRQVFRGTEVTEVRMFGGTAFMVNGHMTVAVSPRGLLVRVGAAAHDEAVKKPGVRAMVMRDRIMTGYIYVDPVPGDARTIRSWVQSALLYNQTLPPKEATRAHRPAPKKRATTKRSNRR